MGTCCSSSSTFDTPSKNKSSSAAAADLVKRTKPTTIDKPDIKEDDATGNVVNVLLDETKKDSFMALIGKQNLNLPHVVVLQQGISLSSTTAPRNKLEKEEEIIKPVVTPTDSAGVVVVVSSFNKVLVDYSTGGVSFNYLKQIVKGFPDNATMNEVCNELIKPLSKDVSFIEYLAEAKEEEEETTSKEVVKIVADYFVSYCWGYPWNDLVSSLERFQIEQNNNQDFFVWIDSFVVNQHTSMNVSQQQWIETFGDALKKIGKALILLIGWKDLLYVSRAWCVFEMFTIVSSDIQFHILLAEKEEQDLRQSMISYKITFEFVEAYLSKINIEKSKASKAEDKDMILSKISQIPNGIFKVNDIVLNEMKRWLLKIGRKFIQESAEPNSKEVRAFYYSLYNIHSTLKEKKEALEVSQDLLRVSRIAYGEPSFEVGVSLVNIGTIYDETGRPNESLKAYEQALSNYRQVLPENHMQIGILLNNMGLTLKGQRRYEEALLKYEESLKIKSSVDPESLSVASNLSTMGVVHNLMGNYDKAMECHLKALKIRVDKLGEEHLSVAVTHNNLAFV